MKKNLQQKIVLFIFVLSQLTYLNVAAQNIQWQNTIGGISNDMFTSIQPTSDGGTILGGYSDSPLSGDKTEGTNGLIDYWIVKVNATGSIQWQNTIGGSENDYFDYVEQTMDGGYICSGHSASNISGDKTENNYGTAGPTAYDYWIVKLNSSGTIQWQNTIGSDAPEGQVIAKQTADGGYIIGGTSSGPTSGDKTEDGLGGSDYWILKLDASGNIVWQNTIGGDLPDILYDISQTSDGGYICCGYSLSGIAGDKTENSMGGSDYWVLKLDATGNIMWQNTIGGSLGDNGKTIKQTPDGGYILAGTSASGISGDKTEPIVGAGGDYWILKLDNAGNILWQNAIGGSDSDQLTNISIAADGGYICSGFSRSLISGDKNENRMTNLLYDFWIVKLNQTGNMEWQNTIGGDQHDYAMMAFQHADGSTIIGGQSGSDISFDKTENSYSGSYDYWIMKLDNSYNLIQGQEFIDLNSNGVMNGAEPPLRYKKVIESNTSGFAVTDYNGHYSLQVSTSGNFTISPFAAVNYYSAVPSNYAVNFPAFTQIDSLNDFAFQPAGSNNDLSIEITPVSLFRPGRKVSYIINYKNIGTTTLTPSVVIKNHPGITYFSSDVTPATINTDSVVYNINPIPPYNEGQVLITYVVPTSFLIGTQIVSSATVSPLLNDANPVNNLDTSKIIITSSFDPNLIEVSRSTIYDFEIPAQPWLEYTIKFQNTGNDTAFYVRIENKLSSSLDLSSFEIINTSHPCSMMYLPYDSTFKFIFENILLPDSTINEPGSHGFVKYRIKTKNSLTAGQLIQSSAGIFFDYNAPVFTNTAVTQVISPTGIHEYHHQQLNLFPNPANDYITLSFNVIESELISLDLYTIQGRHIMRLKNEFASKGKYEKTFDLKKLSAGVYLLKINGKNPITTRFIKM